MTTVLLLVASLAQAQDAAAVDWKAQEAATFEKPEGDLSLEVGGSYTSGNSEFFTIYGKLSAAYRVKKNKVTFGAAVAIGQSKVDANGDGILSDAERSRGFKPSAERYAADVRYDRFLTPRDSLYFLVGGFRDTFAGYDYRLHEQIGYSRVLVRNERPFGPPVAEGETQPTTKTELVGEIGIDWAQEDYVAGVDPNFYHFIAGRLMLQFTHQFNPDTQFMDKVQVYESFFDAADLRVNNEATFTTKIGGIFSLKLSNFLIFDNVPVTGYRKFDQTTLVTLVADII